MTEQSPTSQNFSQSDALQDIVSWSATRPPWQQDALRRIVTNSGLTDIDLDELEDICLDERLDFDPLSASIVTTESSTNAPISLTEIKEPKGVNALATGQSLCFKKNGLNIIYGDNGSGKSGYVRILKNACRTRDAKIAILSDINESGSSPQSATLFYSAGANDLEYEWGPDTVGDANLNAVSIFDARSATTHVQSENSVAYIPFPMQVIQQLANACDNLKERLDRRIADIKTKTPQSISNSNLSSESPVGVFLGQLSHKSNLETLTLLTDLSDAEKLRLTTLEADLAQDPKKASAKLTPLETRLTKQSKALLAMTTAASETSARNIGSLRGSFVKLAQLSKAASEELFSSSPLPDIGGEAWKTLWEAARLYSDEIAYPEKQFPEANIGDDLCVLCQQPLQEEAVKRRVSFEEFIKSTAKADETAAKRALDSALDALKVAYGAENFGEDFETLVRDELDDGDFAKEVRKCIDVATQRMKLIESAKPLPVDAIPYPQAKFDALTSQLEKRIAELSADETSPERKAIVQECRSLKERSKLSDIAADVEAQILRLKQIERLKDALKTVAKRSVTNKNKELSDKLVTDALRGRFAREVRKLKIGTIPLELKKVRDSNAQSIFQVEFTGLSGKPVGEVLSEGEHRCVALAAFLAELVTSHDYSAIVFDDPMSSLDHLYRQKVAKRLVEEAAHRQVIVFTHDLSFLFELKREAEAQETSLHFQHVHRRNGKPGHVADELPMKAKKAAQRAHDIQKILKDAKGSFDNLSDVERTIFVKGALEQLREAWDQAIADFVQPVLGRFDSKIAGSSIFKLLDLTESDVKVITTARSRLSERLHTASESQNADDVSHDELCKEVKELLDWLEEFKKRPNKAVKPKISIL